MQRKPGWAGSVPPRECREPRHQDHAGEKGDQPAGFEQPCSPSVDANSRIPLADSWPSGPHARLRPDRQPAHRVSPPPQPLPPLAHKKRRGRQESCPSCVRATAGLNATQLDPKPPPGSGYTPATCGHADQGDRLYGSRAPGSRCRELRSPHPLTRPDLAHDWPTATGNGLPNRSQTRIRPGIREHRHRV
jgi:hypothetical protein